MRPPAVIVQSGILYVVVYPFPRWRPQLGAKPMNISIRAKVSAEREPVIGQTLVDMRGRKLAWEGIMVEFYVDIRVLMLFAHGPSHLLAQTG